MGRIVVANLIAAVNVAEPFPFVNIDALFEAGVLRLRQGTDTGGAEFGPAEARAVVSEIARGEPSTALVLAMHYVPPARPITDENQYISG